MLSRSRTLIFVLITAVIALGAGPGCGVEAPKGKERWAATHDTTVDIDWDKVNTAYKEADGPADLERRINEIYEGEQLISVSVQDLDEKTQVVTGFFDKNSDGQVAEGEKIFTIQRDLKPDGTGQYQTHGHGAYAGYASPMMGIMTGMLMGSMMSSMFAPRYVPMYTTPYTTSSARTAELRNQRAGYRAQHPERYNKSSQTGRKYGGTSGSKSQPPSARGGSRFGVRREAAAPRPRRLAA
ncbi:MAG: hypothetical protein F9K40_11830 [Kofleriaceae bacterium]|nr:MAG: hypothetical protein F9K40_11830 [Kofleriaceae bacterium]